MPRVSTATTGFYTVVSTDLPDGAPLGLEVARIDEQVVTSLALSVAGGEAVIDVDQDTVLTWPTDARFTLVAPIDGQDDIRIRMKEPGTGNIDFRWRDFVVNASFSITDRNKLTAHVELIDDRPIALQYRETGFGWVTLQPTIDTSVAGGPNNPHVLERTLPDGEWEVRAVDQIEGTYATDPVSVIVEPVEVVVDDRDLAFDEALSEGQYDDTDWDNSVAPLSSIFWEPNGTDVVETGTFHGIQGMRVRLDDSRTPSTRMGAAAEIPASQSAEIEFHFVFEEGFSWGTNKFTGKFGFGLGGGSRKAGGNASASDTATQTGNTTRLIWEGNGDGTANIQSYNYEAATTGWGDKYDTGVTIVEGTVYTARLKQVMNSAAGVADGVLQLRIFDKETGTQLGSVIRNNMTWFGQGDPQVDSIVAWTFHGGANVDEDNYSPIHPSFVVFSGVNYEYSENVVTVPVELFNDGIIHNIPILPIANLTEISLLAVPTVEVPHTYRWTRIQPTESGVLGTAERLDFMLGQASKTFEFRLEVFGSVVSGGGGLPSSDRRTRLLNMVQPATSMLSRTGFGMNAGGGTNYVTVTSLAGLIAAIRVDNNYVIIDESVDGEQWNFNTTNLRGLLFSANNVTVDGADAPSLVLYNPNPHAQVPGQSSTGPNITSCRGLGSNVIIHCLNFKGPGSFTDKRRTTCMSWVTGKDIWIDHVSIEGFAHDDGIVIGSSSSSNNAYNFTISNVFVNDDCFANFSLETYAKDTVNGNVAGNITIHSCLGLANERMFKNDGGTNCHVFNCRFKDQEYAKIRSADTNQTNQGNPFILSESNHYSDPGPNTGNFAAEEAFSYGDSTHSDSIIWTDGNSIFGDGYMQSGDVRNPGDGNYNNPPVMPYTYEKIPAANVDAAVLANAGCRGDISYSPAGSGPPQLLEAHSVLITTAA